MYLCIMTYSLSSCWRAHDFPLFRDKLAQQQKKEEKLVELKRQIEEEQGVRPYCACVT